MRVVLDALVGQQRRFATLPFFRRLEGPGSLDDALTFIPGLTFFVMAFQDILRLNEARMVSPQLARMVTQHRREDDGHEQWFLHDVDVLKVTPDLRWLFGAEHSVTRDVSYSLVSEVLNADDDRIRVVVVEVLEATGEVFFSRVPAYLERAGYEGPLRYFSTQHHERERDHEILEKQVQSHLRSVELPPEIRERALAVVGRSFAALTTMVTDLEQRIVRAQQQRALGAASSPAGASS